MGPKAKKAKLSHADPDQAEVAALEEFLFGGPDAALKAVQEGGEGSPVEFVSLGQQEAPADAGEEDFFFLEDREGDSSDASDDEQQQQGQQEEGSDVTDDEQQEEEWQEGEGRQGAEGSSEDEAGPGPGSQQQQRQSTKRRSDTKGRPQPVWSDPADAALRIDVASKARLRKLRSAKGQETLSGKAYERALRGQHAALNPRTSWAQLASAKAVKEVDESLPPAVDADDDDGGDLLLRSVGGLLATAGRGGSSSLLGPGAIDMSRLRNANQHGVSASVVRSVRFHPNGQLLLTAGFDKRLRLFSVDGLRNPLLQSVFLADCPIQRAEFAAGGGSVVATGRRPFYYVYDLHSARVERVSAPKAPGSNGSNGSSPKSIEAFAACSSEANPLLAFMGDAGHVQLVSLRSRQGVGSIKMNGSARCAVFNADGTQLLTSGGDGIIYTWDLRTRRCLHQQVDEGNIGATSLALNPDGSLLASGSASGVVNVYRRPASLLEHIGSSVLRSGFGGVGSSGILGAISGSSGIGGSSSGAVGPVRAEGGAPVKALLNLTTAADTLEWSPDGQILAIGSRLKRDNLRLVHVPSFTTFSNWPTAKTPLQYVHCCAFSPHGGFLSIGNAKGHALLYRLHHYADA